MTTPPRFTNNTKRLLRTSLERSLEELKASEYAAAADHRRKQHQADEAAKRLAAIRRDVADAKAALLELRGAQAEPSTPLLEFLSDHRKEQS